jgi:hypothetical protein
MPRLTKYRKHRPSGQAIVTLGGKELYLGPHGPRAGIAEYDRLTGEWLANGRSMPTVSQVMAVSQLCAAYWV